MVKVLSRRSPFHRRSGNVNLRKLVLQWVMVEIWCDDDDPQGKIEIDNSLRVSLTALSYFSMQFGRESFG